MDSKNRTLSLFMFIDGFGWEIAQKYGFMKDILTTQQPLQTVFGYSSTCDPTILTGKDPQEHGHFSFFYYRPEVSPFHLCRYLSVLPKSITRRGRIRRYMSKAIQKYYGYNGYFQIYNMPFKHLPLFDYSEKKDLYQPDGINNGCSTVFDDFRDESVNFHMSDWRLKEPANIASLKDQINHRSIQFGYLFCGSLDGVLHQYGTDHPQVQKKLNWYETEFRSIIKLAENNYDEVRVCVFSDHGMANVTSGVDIQSVINECGYTFGDDYAAVYDSTMARFWFFNDSAEKDIRSALSSASGGRILSDEDLSNYKCQFENKIYGELFFLMNPGTIICPSFMGETMLEGMHGYDPNHQDSTAFIASNASTGALPNKLQDMKNYMKRSVAA